VAPGSSVRPSDPRPPTFLRLRDRAPRPPLRRRSWKSRVGTADLGKWLTERRKSKAESENDHERIAGRSLADDGRSQELAALVEHLEFSRVGGVIGSTHAHPAA